RLGPHRDRPRPADRGGHRPHRVRRQGRLQIQGLRLLMSGALDRRWRVPVVAGALIVASLLLGRTTVPDGLADLLMVAAAVVAGAPIVLKAWRALLVKVVGIDLLVAVAAIGATIIGEYWEAAAVTFLFAVGHALEAATLDRTRS